MTMTILHHKHFNTVLLILMGIGALMILISVLLSHDVFATAVTIEDPNDLSDVHIIFNASFVNGTTATLDQNITRTQGDLLVTLLNGVVNQKIDPDKLQNLDLGMEIPEEETEEETDNEDVGGGSGSGGGDDGGFDPGPIESMPPEGPGINPWPPEQPEPEPPEDGDGGDEGRESEDA